jgi:signal transduction histidine kinase
MHPDDVGRATEEWEAATQSGQPLQLEIRYREVISRQFRWHLVRAQPVRSAAGDIIRWLGTSTDIDDQKRAEESLRRADRSKDEFLAMLGHELRNPLAAVVNAASLLQFEDLDQDSAGRAREIMTRQLSNMTRMLDDLLDLARITQGKVQLTKERVDLVEIARRAALTSSPLIEARQHELTIQLSQEAIWLHADPTRLEQVVVNLLNNAAKYTEPGGKICLTVERDREEARLIVRDNGMGMNREALAQAFELFAQADRSLDHSQGGLGVGLAMVKSLVKMHGGQVRAHSDGIGRGTEVAVILPIMKLQS